MSQKGKVLILDETSTVGEVLRSLYRSLEHRVRVCGDVSSFIEVYGDGDWDVVICPVARFGELRDLLSNVPGGMPSVLVTCSYSELGLYEEASRLGACGRLTYPVRAEEALRLLEHGLELSSWRIREPSRDRRRGVELPEVSLKYGLLAGEHESMKALYAQLEAVADTEMTVLIRGESGTGKELIAKAVHWNSRRRGGPFIAVNCTSIPENLLESELFGHVKGAFTGAVRNKEGLFQAANGGTLFMDEIGSIPQGMQLSLLRILQDGQVRPVGGVSSTHVDVRVVAATNEDLESRMKEGKFREDLFYRLSAFPLHLPPLRDRRSDIPVLVSHFLECEYRSSGVRFAGFTEEALDVLTRYDWPGNIRELGNALRRIIALSGGKKQALGVEDLPEEFRRSPSAVEGERTSAVQVSRPPRSAGMSLKAYLRICERDYIREAIESCGGDKEAAAKLLGISRGTLYRKLEED